MRSCIHTQANEFDYIIYVLLQENYYLPILIYPAAANTYKNRGGDATNY